jgi:hypothetical protein
MSYSDDTAEFMFSGSPTMNEIARCAEQTTEKTRQLSAHLSYDNRVFDVTCGGGAYVHIRFAGHPTPSEVINVWDDETGSAQFPFSQFGLQRALLLWILQQDSEEMDWALEHDQPVDDWYAAYVENTRYS